MASVETAPVLGADTIGEVLAWSRGMIEPAMRDAVEGLPQAMRRIAGYHFGWWDEQGRPSEGSSGKVIRPALVLLTAEAVGGIPAASVPAAVAVELVHNFSLLHDDVMDGDTTRRHRATAWSVFGLNAAILAGDALLSVAMEVVATSKLPDAKHATKLLNAAVLDLLDGQFADLAFEDRTDVDVDECVAMAIGKTAALPRVACALGGMYGGGSAEQVTHLAKFGEDVGLAFQLVDDLLGIWGDPAATGKSIYSDLQNRKKSLPVVFALTSGTPAARELAALYQRTDPLDTAELAHAAALVEAAGGRDWAQQKADDLLAQGLAHLQASSPRSRAGGQLTMLARLITQRDR
ncbi:MULTISPECIES: family 2 encapsulin nanocompartment cargo protein polyprenyl transferase [unclassified Crossiella]|uniref:family 2 encapsulin nanocompartment cargo protein polyprenyl transferase n=1 Tax=unclassified Crossiella TaxID=2620835 RepID=UPI001FFFB0CB|nr:MULTISPECIES: family 2 encapsulin nanocompartment cargo protein polyprenyl transferase [unclassified Crossiella]MCK2237314.1 polyprenyl synthetase family protein [Crossiella sp. S99.2]MCK2250969.1 polyprenyl synthetase family protein [Crossiella sp. S99.1]